MYELIGIDISNNKPKFFYPKEFNTRPRMGEWIEID